MKRFAVMASMLILASAAHAEPSGIRYFLEDYCYQCHDSGTRKGKLDLETLKTPGVEPSNAETWQEVVDQLTLSEMPPKKADQPSDAERLNFLKMVRAALDRAHQVRRSSVEVVLRRLNRTEYNNTMRDLTGLDLRLADQFPADIAIDGFDNIGKGLTISPYLMERYLQTAKWWLGKAILTERSETAYVDFYPRIPGRGAVVLADYRRARSFKELSPEQQAKHKTSGRKVNRFHSEDDWRWVRIPHEGRYRFRILMSALRSSEDVATPRVRFIVASGPVGSFSIPAPVGKRGEPRWFEFEARLPKGIYNFRGEYLNPDSGAKKNSKNKSYIQAHWFEIEGPLYESWPPKSMRRLLPPELIDGDEKASARRVLSRFMARAWRRPVTEAEVDDMVNLFAAVRPEFDSFEQAIQHPLAAVLASPHFLYMVESEKLGDHELASRLSYFLWSSMPDERLLRLASEGKLRDADVLASEMDRMLADPKSKAFVENFVGQWLGLRRLDSIVPSASKFSEYNRWLKQSMRQETTRFFRELLEKDLSVLNFIDSDFTFLNDVLARHYKIEGVEGSALRRVALPEDSRRGGVLTQASVLTLTADGTDTSPVHRGAWMLKNFLGTPPPPPPASVPELEQVAKQAKRRLTLREKLEVHRESAACAACHVKIDPLGFALESFDAVGAFRRYVDKQKTPADPRGILPDGTSFDGVNEFKRVLLEKRRDVFMRGLTGKLMTYALGRSMDFSDRKTIDGIVDDLKASHPGLRTLVRAVVTSEAFRSK